MVLRIAIAGRSNTPNLFEIIQAMGENRVIHGEIMKQNIFIYK